MWGHACHSPPLLSLDITVMAPFAVRAGLRALMFIVLLHVRMFC